MNAREMFEELGYEYSPTYKIEYKRGTYGRISFYGESVSIDGIGGVSIESELLSAIHEQMKELGWL